MKNTMSFLSQKKKNILKRLLRNTVCAVILSAAIFSGSEAYAQLTQSVQTKEAREVTATSAIIELELSDIGFQSHGFAIKSLNEFLDANPNSVLTGLSTKDQIGECITDIVPNPSNPYTPQSRVRSLQKNNLTDGEAYYYYSCATTTDGNLVSGEIKFFVIPPEYTCEPMALPSSGSFPRNPRLYNILNLDNGRVNTYAALTNSLNEFTVGDIGQRRRQFKFDVWARSTNDSCLGSEIVFNIQGEGQSDDTPLLENISIPSIINFDGGSTKRITEIRSINLADICDGSSCSLTYTYTIGGVSLPTNRSYEFSCSSDTIACNESVDIVIDYGIKNEFGTGGSQGNCSVGDITWGISNMLEGIPVIGGSIATLNVQLNQCQGQNLSLSLMEVKASTGALIHYYDLDNVDGTETDDEHIFIPPEDGNYQIVFKAGHDECDSSHVTFKCLLGVQINRSNGFNIFETEGIKTSDIGVDKLYEEDIFLLTKNLKDGLLYGKKNPDVGSGEDWVIQSENGLESNQINLNPQSIQTAEPEFDADSPCLENPQIPSLGYKDDCYEFLAPIPGFGVEQKDSAGVGTGRVTVDLSTLSLGDYLNQIFQIALGILMVLAVIMIVVGGVQYMTSEAIFQKTEAKDTITKAVAGLILGLGIFVILNTINPRLLEIDFGEGIDIARINTVVDPAAVDGNGSSTSVSNVPATNICNNRKDRGYWLGQNSYKLTQIAETANNLTLGSLEATGVNFKTNVNSPKGTSIKKQAEEGFSQRVKTMIASLNDQNITTRITEAFGPSFLGHGSPCHYLGSCIDLATGTDAASATYSVDDVEKIIRTADQSGLTAQFEFSNAQSLSAYQDMQKELGNRGIDRCMVKYVTGATNWHFSIYDKTSPELTLSDS
jgi:hypothetical protein